MSTEKTPYAARIDIVIAAIAIQYCLGVIYAWSAFTPTLVEAGWTKSQTQTVFSVGLVTFAVVIAFGGAVRIEEGSSTQQQTTADAFLLLLMRSARRASEDLLSVVSARFRICLFL